VQLPGANLILTTPDLSSFAASAAKSLGGSIRTVALNLGSFPSLHALPEDVATFQQQNTTEAEPIISPPRTLASPAALVYTSGTTGKPKACSVKFALVAAVSCPSVADTQNPKKYLPVRTYSCMPLFHGTTLFTGLCYSVGTSGCFCLSRKFSARTFWKEVYFSRATKILYVGELCRFLLATPRGDWDTRHSVLVAHGNGLQRDVWVAFQKRFAVPEIREFYRSTEGLVKYDNRHRGEAGGAGKVTFAGSLKRRLEKDQFIVKFDYESEAPYRNGQGFCVLAPVGEPGEAIARVKSVAMYPNYHGNPAATEAKIIRNVFEEGDAFQKSGDLLVQEASGWVRFVDRIGDTFRWKGENVSAGEIRSYISELLEVEDVVVVGKRLPAYDGQAGAAAISLGKTSKEVEKKFVESLYGNLKRKGVPAYAFPRLVVITDDIKVGDTFKHAKHIVKALEWKPDGVNSNKYWLDGKQYIQLQEEHWGRIESGRAKL
jgi:acyl-CoA synthetase (AMP-forming)/AMP-acid ligase II